MAGLIGTFVNIPTLGLLLSGGGGVTYLVSLVCGVPKMFEDVVWLCWPGECDDEAWGVKLEPKMLLLGSGEGVKNLVPAPDDPPKILPDTGCLVFLEEPGVEDLALVGTVVCNFTLGRDPKQMLFRRGGGLEIPIPLVCGLSKRPVTELSVAFSKRPDEVDLPGIVEDVRTLALVLKRLLLWEDEGAKIPPSVVCGASNTLVEAAWLLVVLENTPGGGDRAETDVDVWTLELDPRV